MQHTRLQAIAQAVVQRQDCYQRKTLLFDQLAQLLVQGRPVAPELLARRLHRDLDEVRAILRTHPELEYDTQDNLVGSGLLLSQPRTSFRWSSAPCLPGAPSIP